jgi:predicted transcriptional regulator YdeE
MKTIKKEAFKIIGIPVRTTNEHMQAMKDIPALWERFFKENTSEKISAKESDDLYCVYTAYEKDHTKPYTTILGHKVSVASPVPDGLMEVLLPEQSYRVFTAKGKPQEGSVYREWQKIWNSDTDRLFTSDFEIYGARSQDAENAEVDIYIAVR